MGNSGSLLWQRSSHEQELILVSFSPNGKRALTTSYDGTVRIWDVSTGNQLFVVNFSAEKLSSVEAAYGPDGKHIVVAPEDQTARILDADSMAELQVLKGHNVSSGQLSSAQMANGY